MFRERLIGSVTFISAIIIKFVASVFLGKERDSIKNKDFSNIIVIKLWAIGEVCINTSVIRALRKRYPSSRITVIVGMISEPILRFNPHLNHIIAIDERIFLKFNLPKIYGLIRELRKKKFDLAIILHKSLYLNLFAFMLNIPIRLGFDRNGEGALNTHSVTLRGKRHLLLKDENIEILKKLGIEQDDWKCEVYPGKEEEKFAQDFFNRNKISELNLVVGLILAGGNNPAASAINSNIDSKVWPIENYLELSKKLLQDSRVKVIFFGGEFERNKYADKIHVDETRIFNLLGKLSLLQLVALLKCCDYIVANDCGPMHIASALNVPMVVILGPTGLDCFRHFTEKIRVVKTDLKCSPCFDPYKFPNTVVKCKNNRCMKEIPSERIYKIISEEIKLK